MTNKAFNDKLWDLIHKAIAVKYGDPVPLKQVVEVSAAIEAGKFDQKEIMEFVFSVFSYKGADGFWEGDRGELTTDFPPKGKKTWKLLAKPGQWSTLGVQYKNGRLECDLDLHIGFAKEPQRFSGIEIRSQGDSLTGVQQVPDWKFLNWKAADSSEMGEIILAIARTQVEQWAKKEQEELKKSERKSSGDLFNDLKKLLAESEDQLEAAYSASGVGKHEQDDYNGVNYVELNYDILRSFLEDYEGEDETTFQDYVEELYKAKSPKLEELLPTFGITGWDSDDFKHWIK